ncbi:hypothetical protein PR048_002028 [Dryococelus australis]|uniref:Uncharacterized protein n=1 Tax=Dryococelus australis TaxID=614101 RepID=A0ABQ9IJ03_9NEOP|nr:hypothetical protein PR048_002028 [Dryococelus australis]
MQGDHWKWDTYLPDILFLLHRQCIEVLEASPNEVLLRCFLQLPKQWDWEVELSEIPRTKEIHKENIKSMAAACTSQAHFIKRKYPEPTKQPGEAIQEGKDVWVKTHPLSCKAVHFHTGKAHTSAPLPPLRDETEQGHVIVHDPANFTAPAKRPAAHYARPPTHAPTMPRTSPEPQHLPLPW